MKNVELITISIPKDLLQRLKEFCIENDLKLSGFLRNSALKSMEEFQK